MSFLSSVTFQDRVSRIRRATSEPSVEPLLPPINKRSKSRAYTPIKLKLVPLQADRSTQQTREIQSRQCQQRQMLVKKKVYSLMQGNLQKLSVQLGQIRKQIVTKQEQHHNRAAKESQRRIILHEVNPDEEQYRESDPNWQFHERQLSKRYILKPVWNKKIVTPRRESRRVFRLQEPEQKLEEAATFYPSEKLEESQKPCKEEVEEEKSLIKIDRQSVEDIPVKKQDNSFSSNYFFPLIQPKEFRPTFSQIASPTNGQKNLRQHHSVVRKRPRDHLQRGLKNFRKIAHVVLFTIYLRTFNERMHLYRKTLLEHYLKKALKPTLLELKHTVIQYSASFFETIADHHNFDYYPHPKDDPPLRREKIKATKKLVHLQLDCLIPCIAHLARTEKFIDLFYHLCKHGNYSCLHSIHTPEQMNVLCISPSQGYISAGQHLQKSALISLLFIKILLFNIFFEDETISMPSLRPRNKENVTNNISLIGNILYQLFIDIQDDLLEQAPSVYTVGNWVHLQHRFNFKVAENMTVRDGIHQTNQLISGLMDHKIIKEAYNTKQMASEKHMISTMLVELHKSIMQHHLRVRQKCFLAK